MLMAVLHLISIRPFTFHRGLLRFVSWFVFGLGICLLSTMSGKDAQFVLELSPWLLPITTISIALSMSQIPRDGAKVLTSLSSYNQPLQVSTEGEQVLKRTRSVHVERWPETGGQTRMRYCMLSIFMGLALVFGM
jgi:hypothetical protein